MATSRCRTSRCFRRQSHQGAHGAAGRHDRHVRRQDIRQSRRQSRRRSSRSPRRSRCRTCRSAASSNTATTSRNRGNMHLRHRVRGAARAADHSRRDLARAVRLQRLQHVLQLPRSAWREEAGVSRHEVRADAGEHPAVRGGAVRAAGGDDQTRSAVLVHGRQDPARRLLDERGARLGRCRSSRSSAMAAR